MRQEYDFSKAVKNPYAKKLKQQQRGPLRHITPSTHVHRTQLPAFPARRQRAPRSRQTISTPVLRTQPSAPNSLPFLSARLHIRCLDRPDPPCRLPPHAK